MYYNNDKSVGTDKILKIPITKNEEEYSINSLASEQKKMALAVIDTINNFSGTKNHTFPSVQPCGLWWNRQVLYY